VHFIQEAHSQYLEIFTKHRSFVLHYCEFLIYENSGRYDDATQSLQNLAELQNLGGNASIYASNANFIRACTLIAQSHYADALEQCKYVNCSDTSTVALLKHVLPIYIARQKAIDDATALAAPVLDEPEVAQASKAKEVGEPKTPDLGALVVSEVLQTHSQAQESKESDADSASFDREAFCLAQRELHYKCQRLKTKLCQEKIDQIGRASPVWYIKDQSFDAAATEIYQVCGKPDYYAMIGSKVLGTLEKKAPKLLEQYESALRKGVVSRDRSSVGIKWVEEDLIEIKINDDHRLYTSTIYQNPDGKCLIIFDHDGRHKKVAAAAKSHLTIIKTLISPAEHEAHREDASSGSDDSHHSYSSIDDDEDAASLTGGSVDMQ
jgi:hypothetical protein